MVLVQSLRASRQVKLTIEVKYRTQRDQLDSEGAGDPDGRTDSDAGVWVAGGGTNGSSALGDAMAFGAREGTGRGGDTGLQQHIQGPEAKLARLRVGARPAENPSSSSRGMTLAPGFHPRNRGYGQVRLA